MSVRALCGRCHHPLRQRESSSPVAGEGRWAGGHYPEQNFDFLGHTFRPRGAMNRSRKMFVSFIPAVSAKATKAMHSVLRQWKFSHRGDLALEELVRWLLPIVRGWVNYYGRFNP